MGQFIPASPSGYGARATVTRRIEGDGQRGGAQAHGMRPGVPGGGSSGTGWHTGAASGAHRTQGRTASGKSAALSGGIWSGRQVRAGAATVGAVAFAQMIAGLAWSALTLLLWYLAVPTATHLAMLALCGALIAAGSALSMELARGAHGSRLRVARALLPAVDFIAAAGAFWLLAGDGSALPFLLVPALLATTLLGWRIGAIVAGASVLTAVAMWLVLGGASNLSSLMGLLPLVLALALIIAGLAAYIRCVRGAQSDLLARARQAEQLHESVARERTGLLDGLHLLEQAQVRLEHERMVLDEQTSEMAYIVRRLADGDRQGARQRLARVMAASAPIGHALADLVAGINQLAHQEPAPAVPEHHLVGQRRQAGSMALLLDEQSRLLNTTDLALRDQAAVANQLVAAIQLLAHSAGGPASQPTTGRQLVARKLHDMEQLALSHASSTAMLGARMAQMRKRQEELDVHVRGLAAGPVAGSPSGHLNAAASVSGVSGVSNAGSPDSASVFGRDSLAATSQPWAY